MPKKKTSEVALADELAHADNLLIVADPDGTPATKRVAASDAASYFNNHSHAISAVTGLQAALDSKTPLITRVSDADGYSHNGFSAVSFTEVETGQNSLGAWVVGNPTRLTIPTDGIYLVHLYFIFVITANTPIVLFLRLNGSTITDQINLPLFYLASGGGADTKAVSFARQFVAGDYLEFLLSTGVAIQVFPRAGITKL